MGAALAKVRASNAAPAIRLALEFVALTACRANEGLGARWSEIKGDTWLIPAARMKAKREHRVPLSRRALEVLQQARRLHDGDLVFPSSRTGRTIPGQTLGATLRRLGIDGTVTDFEAPSAIGPQRRALIAM